MLNKVILIGRMAAEPELRALATGNHLCKLRLATNSYSGREEDGARREFTEFHDVVLFGRLAEVAGTHLQKGRLVYVDGRLRHRSWEGDDGRKRYASEVVADSLQMLGPKTVDGGPELAVAS